MKDAAASAWRFSGVAVAARVLAQDPVAAAMERVTGPSSRMEADLRRLTDEIGGRVTGSAAYDRALQWGVAAFKAAGVDSVKLETYPAPGEVGGDLGVRVGRRAGGLPAARRVASGSRPRPPAPLTAPLVDAGAGTKADFDRLGAVREGRDRARALEAHEVLRRPLRRVPRRAPR